MLPLLHVAVCFASLITTIAKMCMGRWHMTFPIHVVDIVLELNYDWSSTSLIHCQLSQFTIHDELCCFVTH